MPHSQDVAMLRSLLPLVAVLLVLDAHAAPDVVDRAHDALAQGRARTAVALLREAVPRADGDRRTELTCLLGAALLAAEQPSAAIANLLEVPVTAPCGKRAAFLRAQAHEAMGQSREAAALYREVGQLRLGPDRDADSAADVMEVARTRMQVPEQADAARRLAERALNELEIDDARHQAWVRELIDSQEDSDQAVGCTPMLDVLRRADSVEDRLRAARACPSQARQLLAPLERTPSVALTLAERVDDATADLLRASVLDELGDESRATLEATIAESRARRGRVDATAALIEQGTPDSLARAADLLARAGRYQESATLAARMLADFPSDDGVPKALESYAQNTVRAARAALDAGDAATAVATYDALVTTSPRDPRAPQAALEAGIASHRAGDAADARTRWQRVVARWPTDPAAVEALRHLALSLAVDEDDLAAAEELLREQRGRAPALAAVADELALTDVQIEGPPRTTGTPRVTVGTRNLRSVELRLHRIDVEAYIRSGGRPSALRELDVAVVAPDRTWTVDVPDYAPWRDRRFEVPVSVPGPGLYAVTVASLDEEARALVLVSDLSVVARTVGADIAVATFDASGAPVGGTELLVVTSGDSISARTDARGLWVDRGRNADNAVVLASRGGSLAFVETPRRTAPAVGELELVSLLEQPVALPGGTMGLWVRARRGTKPVRGAWTLWLEDGDGHALTPVHATSDATGKLAADLPVPPRLDARHHYRVMALAPQGSEPVEVATFDAAPSSAGGRTLEVRMEAQHALIEVREADGRPAADVVVAWGDASHGRTDAAGRVLVAGPAEGIPWTLRAHIPESTLATTASRKPPELPEWRLHTSQDRLRPTEAPAVMLTGEGPAHVEVIRLIPWAESPALPDDPWFGALLEPGPHGAEAWEGRRSAPRALEELVQTVEVDASAEGAAVPLEPLAPGRWRIRAVSRNVDAVASVLDLEVRADGLRLANVADVGLGDPLALAVDGTAALVTAGGSGLAWARVVRPGDTAPVSVEPGWTSEVTLSAVAPSGDHHERTVVADSQLHVEVRSEVLPDGRAEVVALVTDAAGDPVQAQVMLSGWDHRVSRSQGVPWMRLPNERTAGAQHTVASVDFKDADPGTPIASALKEEARRLIERRKAADARRGALRDNEFARISPQSISVSGGLLGTTGVGAGGGGFGSGGGRFHEGGMGTVRRASSSVPGVRQRVLWQVSDTDEQGRVSAILDGPPAEYRVRATAMTAEAHGGELAIVDTREQVWLVAHEPTAGYPGDRAAPRITVVNGTDEPTTATVQVADGRWPVALAPGEAQTLTVGDERGPGPHWLDVMVQGPEDGPPMASTRWQFPLAAGVPAARGPVVTVAVGPRGSLPLEMLALADDPRLLAEPWRHAVRGRAALAALAVTSSPRLERAVRDARDMLLTHPQRPSPVAAAQAVLFLAELADSGLFDVPRAELEAEATRLQGTATVEAGAWAALARARAALPIDPDLLGFLEKAELTPEHAGLLARTLAWLDRPADAQNRLGTGLHADLARLKLGLPVDRGAWRASPIPEGAERADWVRVIAEKMPALEGEASVQIAGNPAGRLDFQHGEHARFLAEGLVRVDAPGAMVFRANLPQSPSDAPAVQAMRVSRGAGGTPARITMAEALTCNPCTIEPGDALQLPPQADLAALEGTALRPIGGGRVTADTTGHFVVRGLRTRRDQPLGDLHVAVVPVDATDARSPVPSSIQLAKARLQVRSGMAPDLPDADAHPELIGPITEVALHHALATEDHEAIVRHFQRLVAVQPSTALTLAQVRTVALALERTERPSEAVRVWRAGLDAAFRAEVGRLDALRGALHDLPTAKLVYAAAHRYPDGTAVGDALALLPSQLWTVAANHADEATVTEGITALDLRLTAAAWDRELLALQPNHPRAASSGLRLARSLLALGAPEQAARWAGLVASRFPDDPLSDAAMYLHALALTEAQQSGARPLLRTLIEQPFPQPDGSPGVSVHRSDAELVLGRLLEAAGDYDGARDAYREVADQYPAARRSLTALEERRIELPELLQLGPGEEVRLDGVVQGIDVVEVRAYAVDLRTIFVRDGGLQQVRDMAVAGVSPSWSGRRRVDAGPFPTDRTLRLPLQGAGAWLVHAEHDGVRATTLIVRSSLDLHTTDAGGVRRVTARRGVAPATGVTGRAWTPAGIQALTTDVRGVVEVPDGSAVLLFDGSDVAFTAPAPRPSSSSRRSAPRPAPPSIPLEQLDGRLGLEQQRDQRAYRKRFQSDAAEEMSLDAL